MNTTERTMAFGGDGDPSIASKFRNDLRALAGDMEELLKVTAGATGEQIAQARAKAEESLKAAKVALAETQESALVKTRAAARATAEYVRANPWQVLTIAAGAGVALGYLLGRCSGSDS
jgi:ElaB/YqjD/DUF883 family membrane-anchored ribosome-binding protein